MDIAIEEGLVRARVQGSRPEPYEVAIRVTPLSAASWRKLARVLANEAVFLAKLLAGEMPADIESAFAKAGLSLFPTRLSELQTSCSCPDWSNPCKHIAAVYYLLGEEFDRDPFLIFRLRGITRDDLLRAVEEVGEPRAVGPAACGRAPHGQGADDSPFGGPDRLLLAVRRASARPRAGAPHRTGRRSADSTGRVPLLAGNEPLPDALLPIYSRASTAALELVAALPSPAKGGAKKA